MAKYIQLKDRLTGEKEYPITSSAAILMKDGVGNLDDMILNAGKIKDVKVDGESVVDENGVANIDIPQSITIDDSTNTITAGGKTIANILTQSDLDDNIKDAANTAVTAATAHAVEDLVGKLEDLDVDADGTKDTPAPSNIVAAINTVAANAGKIDKILANGTELTITDKKVDIPAATKDAYGLVKVDEALSDSSTNAVTNKAITSNTGLVSAVTENAAKSDGTATGTAPKDLAEAINNVAKNAGAISKVATTDGELTITDKKVTIPDATGTVKGLVNTTDAYDGTDGTKAATGKSIKAALETLDVTEVGEAGKYIQKIKQEDGKITATLADVKDTYTATDTEPISGKGVADALSDLELEETGGTDKIITMVKQEDGKVTATAKTAVEKVATPATTNAYEYKIADASVKVELPKATDTDYGEILLDKDKIDSASTAKTDDPKLMTGKAIEDSLAVKKVNGNASIYAYNSTVPAVDNAIVLGAGASVTAAGGVAVGAGASTASADDVAIGSGASTASNASIAIGNSAATTGDSSIAIGQSSSAAAATAIAAGYDAQAKLESAVAIGRGSIANGKFAVALGRETNVSGESSIAIGKSSTTNGASTIAIGETAVVAGQSAMAIGKGASSESTNAITIGTEAQAQKEDDIAIGTDTTTDGKYAVAIGSNADAEGESAIAIGKDTDATNEQAIAIGKTSATGKKSINIGNNNKTISEGSVAIGDTIQAKNSWETAFGTYNRSVEDDDTVVGTAFTVGRGFPVDGEDPVLYNLIEQKQNADLYIPGIGGFDGTNSSPYDYELDDEGNPKINNDGNPIKKVRPLQESIVEDVVYMKPKEDSGNTQTITGFEAVANVESMSGNLGGFTVYAPLPVIPDEPPTFHIENLPADYCGIAFGFIVPDDDNALAITEESDESYGPYPNPYDLEIPIAMMETMGMTYDFMKTALSTMGGQMCIYLFGSEDKVLATAASANITYEAETAKPTVDYVIESNVSEWIQSTTAGSEIPLTTSKYYDNFESYSTPKFHVKNASSLASFPSTDLLFQFVAYYNGSGMNLDYPHYVSDISDLDDFTLTCVEWTMLAGALPPGVDIHEIGLRLVLSNGWSEELPDMTGITYDVIGQKKDDTPTELESISIVKEHKGVLPFVEKIEDDTDNYHVPNVKAVKQVRKEIEDEFVFVDGSGDKSIKSKAGAAVASGKYAFATQALEMEFDYDVVTKPSIASGNSSVAMIGGEASGNGSFAIQGGKANGLQSTAIGNNAKTSELYAVAIGVETQASEIQAIAIGSNNKASAMCSMAMGKSSEATKEYANALGYYAKAKGMYSTAIGKYVTVTNQNSMAVGLENAEHSDSTYGSEDATLFAIGHGTDMGVNAQEITYDGKMYINGIGGYDGIADDPDKWGAYKKNADGTDYINPLTNKNEHEYYKPLQEVIELMDARIKYLEDIIDQLTQQRNPVEP